MFSIHRLVAMIHLKVPIGKPIDHVYPYQNYIVHHKNTDVTLNHSFNLQWCTEEEHNEIHKNDPDFIYIEKLDKNGLPIEPPF